MNINQRRYLYGLVFISGLTTLAIELSAARLLGNVFGTSNLVWASIIGLILIYLSLGYFLGGKIADRHPSLKVMVALVAWAAFITGLVPIVARPILRVAADAFDALSFGVLFGSFSVVLVLFIVPITLLGMVSPFAIRLLIHGTEKTGSIAGQIYAISTLGSFIGTFLPVLFLIPLLGTTRTFLFFSILLLFMAYIGMVQAEGWKSLLRWLWMLVFLVLLAVFWKGGGIKSTKGQIYETESAYNYIQVLEEDGFRHLRLNEGQGIHSTWHPTNLSYNGPWEQFLVGPFFNPPDDFGVYTPERVKRIAIIGLAAGTLARQATAVFGAIPIDGYEIDPEIIRVGRQYFDMNQPNLNAIAQDGRWGLQNSEYTYSLIGVDAYRPPYIPWHMTTREFFLMVHDHLDNDGVLVINIGRAPHDRRLVEDLTATIQSVFPSVYVMDIPDTFNSILYATAQPSEINDLYQNFLALLTREDIHPLLIHAIERTIVYQQPIAQSNTVYTDDLAPVEWITNSLVLRFIFSEQMETIK